MEIHALVKRKRRIRVGKGFSRGELRAVNLSIKEALKLKIPIDPRRSTTHKENIDALKSFLAKILKSKGSPKSTGKIDEKVERKG